MNVMITEDLLAADRGLKGEVELLERLARREAGGLDASLAAAGERGAGTVRLDVTDTERARPAAALYRAVGFVPTGERAAPESDPALETLVMTRAP
jgi:hypothetical protein